MTEMQLRSTYCSRKPHAQLTERTPAMRNIISHRWVHLHLDGATNWKRILQQTRPALASVQALVLALVVTAASRAVGQKATGETVIQKATEQFESSPMKTTSLGSGVFMLSGDGGNITAIADPGST